jgi:hypothetical protein
MQTYHGEATINNDGQVIVSLPFPHGQKVEIVARPFSDSKEENEAWGRLALEHFLNGYSDQDPMYDHYDEWLKSRSAK